MLEKNSNISTENYSNISTENYSNISTEKNSNISTENYCNICGDILNEPDKIILNCKHEFHYICLVNTFKSKLNYASKIKMKERCCPYCRHNISLLPYRPEQTSYIPGVHRLTKCSKNTSINICNGICKNGKACTFKAKYNGYCGFHKV